VIDAAGDDVAKGTAHPWPKRAPAGRACGLPEDTPEGEKLLFQTWPQLFWPQLFRPDP
jgi:hypothetical protein